MADLKPCPFCGGEAYSDKIGKPLFTIRCTNIDCYAEISKVSYEEAINAWNTRKPMEAVVAELEKYANSRICENHKHGCPHCDNDNIFCENCGALGAIEIVRRKE